MEKHTDEKKALLRAITIVSLLILILCLISMHFAQKASEPPLYTEKEAENIFSTLDCLLFTLDKTEKAQVEEFFCLSGMKIMEFQRKKNGLDLILSDGRTSYIFHFSLEEGIIMHKKEDNEISLFLTDEAVFLMLNRDEIMELVFE